jgi:hypothetical protein
VIGAGLLTGAAVWSSFHKRGPESGAAGDAGYNARTGS